MHAQEVLVAFDDDAGKVLNIINHAKGSRDAANVCLLESVSGDCHHHRRRAASGDSRLGRRVDRAAARPTSYLPQEQALPFNGA
ncbi:hypothetical protein D9M71_821880 [compost metagenome]